MEDLQLLDGPPDFFLVLAEPLLEPAQQFVLFALGEDEVIVGKLAILLLQLAFDFVPVPFDL
jgi:hypothetical protein